ncbi:MAG: ATP-binding cassette domain-containing protein [Solirubrobacteraceae bacterium]
MTIVPPTRAHATDAREPLLRTAGLTVARGSRTVLHQVDLQLHGGELVALIGPNGAGKSTLLEALSGDIQPAAGSIQRNGSVAIALQSAEMARRSVLANLTAALGWWGVPRRQRAQRAREALEAIGAGHLARRPATALSGGERRRVHLARVLAVRPDVLLLDEPFAGLDPEVRAALLADAEQALRSPDRATLVVVHDRAEAWALADRLLILIDGRIVADGTPATLLSAPPSALVARFLGYDGELGEGGELRLTRPAHVVLHEDGLHSATVARVIPLEDGVRLELILPHGRLYAIAQLPAPRVGDRVRVDVDGGARFPA